MILLQNVFLDGKTCDILIDQNRIVQIAKRINAPADEIIDLMKNDLFFMNHFEEFEVLLDWIEKNK